MLKKMKHRVLNQEPVTICKTSAKLAKELAKFGNQKVEVYLSHKNSATLLMFAPEVGGEIDTANAIALEVPCPPFCTKGDNLYVEVP